jgi:hypothetical protein
MSLIQIRDEMAQADCPQCHLANIASFSPHAQDTRLSIHIHKTQRAHLGDRDPRVKEHPEEGSIAFRGGRFGFSGRACLDKSLKWFRRHHLRKGDTGSGKRALAHGGSTADRLGFQRLVASVGLGHVGLVLGLEVSRLARNSSDWHRLLEMCALTQTLILDEEGLYDPSTFNDRLLLGLKGAMSEAELFVMRARLQGGILNKARRGALKLALPIGLCYARSRCNCA